MTSSVVSPGMTHTVCRLCGYEHVGRLKPLCPICATPERDTSTVCSNVSIGSGALDEVKIVGVDLSSLLQEAVVKKKNKQGPTECKYVSQMQERYRTEPRITKPADKSVIDRLSDPLKGFDCLAALSPRTRKRREEALTAQLNVGGGRAKTLQRSGSLPPPPALLRSKSAAERITRGVVKRPPPASHLVVTAPAALLGGVSRSVLANHVQQKKVNRLRSIPLRPRIEGANTRFQGPNVNTNAGRHRVIRTIRTVDQWAAQGDPASTRRQRIVDREARRAAVRQKAMRGARQDAIFLTAMEGDVDTASVPTLPQRFSVGSSVRPSPQKRRQHKVLLRSPPPLVRRKPGGRVVIKVAAGGNRNSRSLRRSASDASSLRGVASITSVLRDDLPLAPAWDCALSSCGDPEVDSVASKHHGERKRYNLYSSSDVTTFKGLVPPSHREANRSIRKPSRASLPHLNGNVTKKSKPLRMYDGRRSDPRLAFGRHAVDRKNSTTIASLNSVEGAASLVVGIEDSGEISTSQIVMKRQVTNTSPQHSRLNGHQSTQRRDIKLMALPQFTKLKELSNL